MALLYNGNGDLYEIKDLDNNVSICYNYDSLDRLISTWQTDGYDTAYTYYTYDAKGRVSEYSCKMNTSGISFAQNYAYNYDSTDNLLNSMTVNNDTISYTYDDVERLTNKTVTSTGINLKQIYSYNDGEYMTQQISDLTVKIGNSTVKDYSYTYDSLGNIKTVYENGVLFYEYVYDAQGQLETEIFYEDDFALDYIYDAYGNIIGFEEYSADKETSYGKIYLYEYENSQWKDQITSYDGVEFIYDSIGNPREYYNGYEFYNFSWQNGRELASADFGHSTVTYKYGADGLRIQKTVDGAVHDYYYSDGLLVREVITYSSYIEILDFLYDESGLPYSFVQSFNYNGTTGSTQFYYVKNLQGDVVAITDASGNIVAEYTYDAWGCVLYTNEYTHDNIGYVNPIRYRSYYQDNETGFYYLQSRYYDPMIKRFINADGYVNANGDILGFNMYAYCGNNPVMGCDPTGKWTYSQGYSFSAFAFSGISYSINFSIDSAGNFAIQTSKANVFKQGEGTILGGLSIGAVRTASITSLDTVDDLEGAALNIGGSANLGPYPIVVGGDLIASVDEPGITGVSVCGGVGYGYDAHVIASETETVFKVNIIEEIKNGWNKFCSGFRSFFGYEK